MTASVSRLLSCRQQHRVAQVLVGELALQAEPAVRELVAQPAELALHLAQGQRVERLAGQRDLRQERQRAVVTDGQALLGGHRPLDRAAVLGAALLEDGAVGEEAAVEPAEVALQLERVGPQRDLKKSESSAVAVIL